VNLDGSKEDAEFVIKTQVNVLDPYEIKAILGTGGFATVRLVNLIGKNRPAFSAR
jgi:hypothetical protein